MIESVYDDFSQIEKKIAQYFLYDYQESDDLSAFALAKKSMCPSPHSPVLPKNAVTRAFANSSMNLNQRLL